MRELRERGGRLKGKRVRFSLSDKRRGPEKRLKDWRRDMREPRQRKKVRFSLSDKRRGPEKRVKDWRRERR